MLRRSAPSWLAPVALAALAGCSLSARQLVPGGEVAGNWRFSGANSAIRTPDVDGERGTVAIDAPARSGRVASAAAYSALGFGLDTDIARLQLMAVQTPAQISWFGIECWYKHKLQRNRAGDLHLLGGISWQSIELAVRHASTLSLASPIAIGGGQTIRDGDEYSYTATTATDSWLLGLGVQQTLWTDWAYVFAQVQLAFNREGRSRESVRITVRHADGSADETLDVLQDDRFDRTVPQAGRVTSGIEAPFLQVAIGLGLALPPFRVLAPSTAVDPPRDSGYAAPAVAVPASAR